MTLELVEYAKAKQNVGLKDKWLIYITYKQLPSSTVYNILSPNATPYMRTTFSDTANQVAVLNMD